MSLTLYSQKPVLIDGDTNICFSIAQSKYLLKQVYLVSERDTILRLTETELKICTEKNIIFQEQNKAYQKIIDSEKQINQNVLAINKEKDEQIKILNKEIAKQKVKTWFSILGGFVSTAFVSYLYIKK